MSSAPAHDYSYRAVAANDTAATSRQGGCRRCLHYSFASLVAMVVGSLAVFLAIFVILTNYYSDCTGASACRLPPRKPSAGGSWKWLNDPAAAAYKLPCDAPYNANVAQGWCPGTQPAIVDTGFTTRPMSEKAMGEQGHFNGTKPLHYYIDWHFDEIVRRPGPGPIVDYNFPRYFAGNVKMVFKVVENGTSSVFVHRSTPAIELHVDDLKLTPYCYTPERTPCIKMLRTVPVDPEVHLGSEKDSDIVQVELDAELTAGRTYMLEMPFNATRHGFKSGIYFVQSLRGDMAVSSLFQMRYARLAAPLVDQPALKATFDVALRHPANYTALGNTRIKSSANGGDGLVTTTFHRTMPLPTYVVTFALYDASYSAVGRFNGSSPQAALAAGDIATGMVYYESDGVGEHNLGWILEESQQRFKRMTRIADMPTVLDKVDYFVTDTPYWGIENMGMIGLGEPQMKYPKQPLGHTTLTHEVIHQWVGNVFTVDHWDIICLQEGLTMYLEWLISNETGLLPIDEVARAARGQAFLLEGYSKPIVRPFKLTQQIADDCFKKPPVFFHMIGESLGTDVLFKFVELMAKKYKFASADMDDWLAVLEEASGSDVSGRMLRSYMTRPGYPVVGAYMSGDKVQLLQYQMVNRSVLAEPDAPFVVVLPYSDDKGQHGLVTLDSNATLSDIVPKPAAAPAWWLLNAKETSYVESVYDIKNYKAIMDGCYAGDYNRTQDEYVCALTMRQLQSVFNSLCGSIAKSIQPVNAAEAGDDWLAFAKDLGAMAKFNPKKDPYGFGPPPTHVRVAAKCTCCLMSKEEVIESGGDPAGPFSDGCVYTWNEYCYGTKMAKFLGRNFKIIGGDDNGGNLTAVDQ